jgi:hypothetical protein
MIENLRKDLRTPTFSEIMYGQGHFQIKIVIANKKHRKTKILKQRPNDTYIFSSNEHYKTKRIRKCGN